MSLSRIYIVIERKRKRKRKELNKSNGLVREKGDGSCIFMYILGWIMIVLTDEEKESINRKDFGDILLLI
jgi:hypothetical protein